MGAPGTKHARADDGCLSHREIAERLGISFARVQQIERRAIAKLRKLIRVRKLEDLRP